jgi:hypothetical protein
MVTPAHIVPEWYFLPFYAILRSIPDKLGGVVAMGGAIVLLLLLPFVTNSTIRSATFRYIYKYAFWFIAGDFVLLGWLGQKPVEDPYITLGLLATIFYMSFLTVLLPTIEYYENLKYNKLNNTNIKTSAISFWSYKSLTTQIAKMFVVANGVLVEFLKSTKAISYTYVLIFFFVLLYIQTIFKFLFS